MDYTGSARFTVKVKVTAPDEDVGIVEAKKKMRETMRRFIEFATAEGVLVYDIDDTTFFFFEE